MITGSLPPATIWGTWSENIEIWSVDDDTLMDLSGLTEVKLILRCDDFNELNLSMSNGDITLPAPGIIQWRAEASMMRTLRTRTYEVIMLLEDGTDTVPLILGSISIVE